MMRIARVVTIGQYLNLGSSVHRLDPRIKIVALIALIVGIALSSSFIALGALALFGLFVLALSRVSPGFIARTLRFAVFILLFFYVLQVLLYQPATAHPHVLWRWWILTVTREGLIFNALVNTRALLLFYFVNMLMLTTSMVDLTDGAESLLSPLQLIGIPVQETTLVMVVALKFVPIFFSELERLIKARAARGVAIDTGNVARRALNTAPVLIPLILGGLRRAEALTVALEARGYNGGRGRTKLRKLQFGPRDALAACALGLALAAAVYLNGRSQF
ncbi:MAG TPA: energy-coupling factor transporter transmembrane component T [Ktedonobacterales bacterium]